MFFRLSGKGEVEDEVEDGSWKMEDGSWKMEDGRESADDDLRITKYEVGSTK